MYQGFRGDSEGKPSAERCVRSIAAKLGLTVDEVIALTTDPERAPALMADVRARFQLSDDYDEDGPEGLQLFIRGVLCEHEAQWLDGVE